MRVLFVTGRPPLPSRRGDQARTASLAAGLAARGHLVRIVAQRPPGIASAGPPPGTGGVEVPLGRGRIAASLLGRPDLPLQVAWHHQPAFAQLVAAERAAFRPDVAVVVLSRLAWTLPVLAGVPVVLDLVDALSLNMRRRAERQPLLAPLLRWEARRMERWDRWAIDGAAVATVVAERDRDTLLDLGVHPGKLAVVPLAIPAPPPAVGPRQPVVLVSGNLGYFPTVEGLRWLVGEVWPRIRAEKPAAELWIAGSRPARRVTRLAADPGVRLVVEPLDLDVLRARAGVAAVALRSGSGTPMKALEAMAAGLPVVTTTAGAQGLDGLPAGAITVADDAAGFAAAALRLLGDPAAAAAQAAVARGWVVDRHDPARVTAGFESLLTRASVTR